VAFVGVWEEVEEEEDEEEEAAAGGVETIWAFCLITSAGVRMAQDTNSAREEAEAWTRAMGRTPSGEADVVFQRVKRDFVCSYVVKNAPADVF